MEKRLLTLELAVEQNTAMCERLDRSMAQLTHAMADLRVQMVQGFAEVKTELRTEITSVQTELRKEIAEVQTELRKEIMSSNADLHKFFERKFMWLMTAHYGGLLALVGFLGKYLIDSYGK